MTKKDLVLIFFILLFWSLNFLSLRMGTNLISPEIFNFGRFLVFLPMIFFIGKPDLDLKRLIFLSLGLNFLNFLFTGFALETGLSAAYISLNSIPRIIFTLLLANFFLSQNLTFKQGIGIFLSCLGVLYLQLEELDGLMHWGILFLFLSALFWSIASIYLKAKNLALSIKDTIWLNAISAFWMGGYLPFGTNYYFDYSLVNIAILTLLILFSSLLGTLFVVYYWYRLNKKYDVVILNSFINFIPLFVLLEEALLLDTVFNMKMGIVFTLLIFSLFLCQDIKLSHFKKGREKLIFLIKNRLN